MQKLLKCLVVSLLALPAMVAAHGPSRLKVEKEIAVSAPAEKVWEVIKDFCAIDNWHPAVAKCEGAGGNKVGATRVLTLESPDSGKNIYEEMTAYDATNMKYKYKITKVDVKVLPVTTYAAEIRVMADGSGSKVIWKGGFYRGDTNNNPPPELNDAAAIKAITGVYEGGLAEIKKLAESQ